MKLKPMNSPVDVYEIIDFFINHFDSTPDNAKALWSFVRGECDHSIVVDDRCILCGSQQFDSESEKSKK